MRAAPRDRAAVARRGRWIALVAGLGAAAALISVAAHRVPYPAADLRIAQSVHALDVRVLELPFHALDALGFPTLVDVVYIGVLFVLLAFGRRWETAAGRFGVLGSAGVRALVKYLVGHPRPGPELIHVEHLISKPSYPAGHVLKFTAFAGFLFFLVFVHMRSG